MVLPVIVIRSILLAPVSPKGGSDINQHCGRAHPFFEGCGIDIGFNRRAWLQFLQCDIDLPVMRIIKVVSGSDHGQNLSGFRILGHQSRICGFVIFFISRDPILHSLFGDLLQVPIQGRDDFQSAFFQGFVTVFFRQLVFDKKHEVRGQDRIFDFRKSYLLCLCRIALVLSNVALVIHLIEDCVFSIFQFVPVGAIRVIKSGSLRHASQIRSLRQVQILGVDPEVGLSRGLNSIGVLPIWDLIQIQLEDVVFRKLLADFNRQYDFFNLTGESFFTG